MRTDSFVFITSAVVFVLALAEDIAIEQACVLLASPPAIKPVFEAHALPLKNRNRETSSGTAKGQRDAAPTHTAHAKKEKKI